MLTNSDLKQLRGVFATKYDLKRLATKDDLTKFATKDDLTDLKRDLEEKIDQRYSDIFDLVDGLAGEVRDQRDFREITTYRIEELN